MSLRPTLLAPLALLMTLVAGPVAAQVAEPRVDTVYVESRHSLLTAGLLEAILPTAGFAYAGNWRRGLLPNAVRLVGLVGLASTGDVVFGGPCEGACDFWNVVLVGGTVWAIVDAVGTARRHNARVRPAGPQALIRPSPSGGVMIGLRIPK